MQQSSSPPGGSLNIPELLSFLQATQATSPSLSGDEFATLLTRIRTSLATLCQLIPEPQENGTLTAEESILRLALERQLLDAERILLLSTTRWLQERARSLRMSAIVPTIGTEEICTTDSSLAHV